MQDYLVQRLRIASNNLLENSRNEEKIQHDGLRGRLRELLINNILSPWLPPYVSCGTGSIISLDDIKRKHTQDDVILFDKSLTPPVLISEAAKEGLFLFNSVLARIEVKSTVNAKSLRDFCTSSLELSNMKFSVQSPSSPSDSR